MLFLQDISLRKDKKSNVHKLLNAVSWMYQLVE